MKKALTFIALLTVASMLSGQKLTSSFGKVTMEDMTMSVFEPDTTAPAVVLYQSGHFRNTDFKYIFLRRVKVLKKEGTNFAEYTFRSDDDTFVKGKVYNLSNGKIVEEKLKSESIYKERIVGDIYLYRIAIPNVQVGTVFEIEYTQFLLPSNFRFQDVIPVIRAEILLEPNLAIDYRKTQTGYISLKGKGDYLYADYVPAFKQEIYTNSIENYISKIDFDVLGIKVNGVYQPYTATWRAVNELLDKHEYFGIISRASSAYLDEIATFIDSKFTTPLEKTKAAYDAIKVVNWNKEERLFPTVNLLRTQFVKGSANSAEMNMMLYHLLQRLKIESNLLVMSTRESGALHPVYPSIEKLNYTIVCATIDGKDYPMDASEKYIPFGMLPIRALNQQARLANNGDGRWINLSPSKKFKENVNYELSMTPAGDLEGNITYNMHEYAAYDFRTAYYTHTSEEKFIETMEDSRTGLEVKDYTFKNVDKIDSACILELSVNLKGKAQKTGDLLMIYPLFYEQMTMNPFKSETRNYPVDFGYARESSVKVKIDLGEGYVVESMPTGSTVRIEGELANFMINYKKEGNAIIMTYTFQINRIMFLPTEYASLRDIYNQIIRKHSEPLILKKVADVN